tara:strand:+ start:165 stop:443 length:279 start_codon:yes stop_codon:yes gene_type:complete
MTTLKEIEYKLLQINKRLGYSVEKYKPYRVGNNLVSNIGHYYLQRAYGRNRILQVVNEQGGARDVSSSGTKAEVYTFLQGMLEAVQTLESRV